MEKCCICDSHFSDEQPNVVLTEKGADSINRFSETYTQGKIKAERGFRVHQKCRKDFCRPKKTPESGSGGAGEQRSFINRRSTTPNFNSRNHCFLCGLAAKYEGKKKGYDVIPVRTMDFQESIFKCCEQRKDNWSETVLGRLEYLRDLHAADAVYHQSCSVNFRTGKQIPKEFQVNEAGIEPKRARLGRPVDDVRTGAFLKTVKYLQDNEEFLTVYDLIKKMEEYLEGSGEEAYSHTYMKVKLKEHFGNEVFITSKSTHQNLVYLRQTASTIISDFYSFPKEQDPETEKLRIVMAAAKLIKSDIKEIEGTGDTFPSTRDMSSAEEALKFVPDLLRSFLDKIFVGKDNDLKLASIAQAIIQASRPRMLLAPLQLGLAVQLHHHFSSKFLIQTLNSHGFCSSYANVQRFERSAAASQSTEIPGCTEDHFIQFMADNVDHNIRTLDGKGTFHGMGIIGAITPGTRTNKSVPNRAVTNNEILEAGKIPIYHYDPVEDNRKLRYKELTDLKVVDSLKNLDILWKISESITRSPNAGWLGTMQNVFSDGSHPGQSSIVFLPMINMDPGDESCIYSTLRFVAEQAMRYNKTPIITFDQPL